MKNESVYTCMVCSCGAAQAMANERTKIIIKHISKNYAKIFDENPCGFPVYIVRGVLRCLCVGRRLTGLSLFVLPNKFM